ncbi:TM0106 family RecB-like putative nuclease [Candidatus Woesearchaeota archaeon]|nr:TM0106 family RecB-like putative nuclease [Candidatus Woesearchaeota archaeon]MBW3016364.1 TM0106 family RecB-like putative nuclease [Candidatus Woesearchaeota archaeon]
MQELFNKCMAGKHRSKYTITGHTVLKYCKNPFIIWCDYFAPPEEREPQTKYMHLLFERGIQHEKNVIKTIYPEAIQIPLVTFETGFKETLEACKKGTNTITGAPIFYLPEDTYGITDVLQKSNEHNSIFGNHCYIIKEIKSAKHIKHEYIMQAALYNYIIGKIQGYTPKKFYLINREKTEYEYEYEKYEEELMQIITGIREVQNGKEVTPTAKSCKWPWEAYCNRQAIEQNDISIVPNIGPALKKQLNEIGITTVQQLATQPISLDIPEATLKKIKTHAQAWLDKKPIIITKPKLPKSKTEIYMDFEGTDELETEEGTVKVDYLIGVLINNEYKPFIAENLADEKRMIQEFLEFMKKHPNATIYHYGPYEKTHLAGIGEKYNIDVKKILDNMTDVLSIVKKTAALPTLTMSLKEVSKFLGFKYRGMTDAQESIVLYLQYLETKEKEIMKRILDYNEDDVRATKLIKEWLETL